MLNGDAPKSFAYTWNRWMVKELYDLASKNGDYIAGGYMFADEPGENSEFDKMMTFLKAGDKIYVPSISAFQFGTLEEFKAILRNFDEKEIEIISFSENNYDFTTYNAAIDIVYDIMFTAFAEEIEIRKNELKKEIIELETRKEDLLYRGGRPKKEIQTIQAIALYNSDRFRVDEVCALTGISRPTLYRALADAEEKDELDN